MVLVAMSSYEKLRAKVEINDKTWEEIKLQLKQLDTIKQAKWKIEKCEIKQGYILIYVRRAYMAFRMAIKNTNKATKCIINSNNSIHFIYEQKKEVSIWKWMAGSFGSGILLGILIIAL